MGQVGNEVETGIREIVSGEDLDRKDRTIQVNNEKEINIQSIPRHEFGALYGGFLPDSMTTHESRCIPQYRDSAAYLTGFFRHSYFLE